ncbi:hypothetical protein [Paraburkholderia kururiensis]|uniref:Uncharacterized protein n=1 Tax=Paraburkholderia kururiensis TaxID=984307 RepID=A0ABZ0WKM9_9BURK|nr:hypothetical protein [Paraburkholderia kururiensis]WQD77909.1 hypothetical protein U0042_28475 [Paraburkholderia kururiensis]
MVVDGAAVHRQAVLRFRLPRPENVAAAIFIGAEMALGNSIWHGRLPFTRIMACARYTGRDFPTALFFEIDESMPGIRVMPVKRFAANYRPPIHPRMH